MNLYSLKQYTKYNPRKIIGRDGPVTILSMNNGKSLDERLGIIRDSNIKGLEKINQGEFTEAMDILDVGYFAATENQQLWDIISNDYPQEIAYNYYLTAIIDVNMGYPEIAEEVYKESINFNPHDSDTFFGLGVLYLTTKKYNKALAITKEMDSKFPEDVMTFVMNGFYELEAKSDYKKAEAAFQTAMRMNSTEFYVHMGLKDVYKKMGLRQKAAVHRRMCRDAMKIESIGNNDG